MRHAKSAWDTGHADLDRPLSNRGHNAAQRMARWLEDRDLKPDRIISSSAARARDTATYVSDHFGLGDVFDCRLGLYGAAAMAWLDLAAEQTCERLLIVGHNPGLDDLVHRLAPAAPRTADGKLMTTAAIAVFNLSGPWSSLAPVSLQADSVHLDELVRPRELS